MPAHSKKSRGIIAIETFEADHMNLFSPVPFPKHHLASVPARDSSILTSHRYRRAIDGINHHTTSPSWLTQLWVQAQDLSTSIASPWTPSSPKI